MLDFFILLENLYFEYEKTASLKVKINLIGKINNIENKILKNMNIDSNFILNYILNNYDKRTTFIYSRYIFFLTNIDIPEKYIEKVINIYFKVISKYKFELERKDIILFSIKGLEKFYFKNFEEKIISLSKENIFKIYKEEFIILLGKTSSSIKTLNFLLEQEKRFPELISKIYWSIAMTASYKNFPMIKRKLLNDFLKKKIRTLNSKNLKNISMFYFILIEILFLQNGIDGNILNKILEILHKNSEKNILKNILIKVINNSEISLKEKEIITKMENLF